MKIPYVSRSQFLMPCTAGIQNHAGTFNDNAILQIPLGPGGYNGHVTIEIESSIGLEFDTDWSGSDPTRFPGRIRAVATALRDCGFVGRFLITHQSGTLSIRRA